MQFSEYFSIWNKLTKEQQQKITQYAIHKKVKAGTLLHDGGRDCLGILLIHSGQLRAYIFSEEGREVTLFRLFEMDICIFTASCMMPNIQFNITVEAEKDSEFWVIPADVYKRLMNESAAIANYTNDIMSSRFSEIMWLVEQIMWKSFDKRLADFLLKEVLIEGTDSLKITHEKIANHMGTAREVVTRMLRYFQSEGLVKLTRGTVEVLDHEGLEELHDR